MKDTETCVGSSLASYFVLFSLISFCFRWFRFHFVDFVSFSLISFRFYFVSHFIGTLNSGAFDHKSTTENDYFKEIIDVVQY
jgi:hypothetical protein